MFSDKSDFEPVGFNSDWRKTLSLKDSSTQADPLKTSENETQTNTMQESGTQTVEPGRSTTKDPDNQINSPSLAKFLARATPIIEKELDSARRSRAFDGYGLIDDAEDKTVTKLHTLNNSSPDDGSVLVSAVTWSSSGSVLALMYEMSEHEEWCSHDKTIDVWNLTRRDFDPAVPNQQITVSSCVTAGKFHPRDPTLLLAGAFTGELMVFSVSSSSSNDPLVASSAIAAIGHREKVTSIQWIISNSGEKAQIISAALDGKLILWSLDVGSGILKPLKVFIVLAEHLPRALKVRSRSKTEVGVTAISLNSEDSDIIMIGTEAGVIFQGSLSSEAPAAPSEMSDEIPWRDPVSVVFSGHRGRVVSLKTSPFHRDIFASLGTDHEIRIFSLLSPHTPALVIHQEDSVITDFDFSPVRPLVFGVTTTNSSLRMFDFKISKAGCALELKATERRIPLALTALSFNKRDHGLVATGDGMGRCHVWKLSNELMSANATETKHLDALVATANEE